MSAAHLEAPAPRRNALQEQRLDAALEGARQRLTTLSNALDDYYRTIASAPGMPPWQFLQAKAHNVSINIAMVSEHLANNYAIFAEANVFPNVKFPGFAEMPMLGGMLRKKLEPSVEDWLEDAEALASRWVRAGPTNGPGSKGTLDVSMEDGESQSGTPFDGRLTFDQWQSHWKLALEYIQAERQWASGEIGVVDYTRAERQKGVGMVKTGLRRQLKEEPDDAGDDGEDDDSGEEEEDDDDEEKQPETTDDKMPIAQTGETPSISMNEYLRFITTGGLPENRQPMANTAINGVSS